MGVRRGSSRRFASSLSRKTAWDKGPGSVTSQTTSASGQVVLGLGLSSLLDGQTVVRIRGEFIAYLTAATALGDGYSGAFGIGMSTQNAFTDIGITALMHPLDDSDWDGWMYHLFFSCKAAGPIVQAAVALSTDNSLISSVRVAVDTKAMRKFDEDMVLFAAIDVDEVGTAVMESQFDSRMLIKLP